MPQDPSITFALAVLSALAIIGGAVLGTRAAAGINAQASVRIACLNAESARDIEQIKAEAQLSLERERAHREWRRTRIQPFLDGVDELRRLQRDLYAAANESRLEAVDTKLQKASEIYEELDLLERGLVGTTTPKLDECIRNLTFHELALNFPIKSPLDRVMDPMVRSLLVDPIKAFIDSGEWEDRWGPAAQRKMDLLRADLFIAAESYAFGIVSGARTSPDPAHSAETPAAQN